MKKMNSKGFTLAELLIVVAIIAVLVAIAIPVFTTQLERSRETTDMANIRSAYAAGQTAALTGYVGSSAISSSALNETGAEYYYNPSVDGSLSSSKDAAPTLGQGTTTDGKADTNSLPGGADYSNTTSYQKQKIKVTIKAGAVSKIEFTS